MTRPRAGGWTLVELMVAIAVLAILAAIAVPKAGDSIERGRSGQCTVNRDLMNKAEAACYLDTGKTCLSKKKLIKGGYLEDFPTCPSGGRYVWRWKNPNKPGYPRMGCTKHYWPKKVGE